MDHLQRVARAGPFRANSEQGLELPGDEPAPSCCASDLISGDGGDRRDYGGVVVEVFLVSLRLLLLLTDLQIPPLAKLIRVRVGKTVIFSASATSTDSILPPINT